MEEWCAVGSGRSAQVVYVPLCWICSCSCVFGKEQEERVCGLIFVETKEEYERVALFLFFFGSVCVFGAS